MAKVTSKYQVTLPKAIAARYGIRPGDHIDWAPAGDAIRVSPAGDMQPAEDRDSRLRVFDQATERHRRRVAAPKVKRSPDRGWKRGDLYGRGRSR